MMTDCGGTEDEKMAENPKSVDNRLQQSVQDEETDNRSKRRKRPRQMFSPDDDSHVRRKQKKTKRYPFSSTAPDRPFDILPNGTPFCCDLCKSRYIVNRFCKKSLKNRRSKHVPAPQQKQDPVTGKTFTLCNACGHTFDHPKKQKKEVPVTSEERRANYIQLCKTWANNLSEKFDLPFAVHLFCPVYKTRPCGCLQDYIRANGDESESQRRASQLSAMASEARRLSALKCYDDEDRTPEESPQKTNSDKNPGSAETVEKDSDQSPSKEKKSRRFSGIGLGNGQKKSEKFAAFVLSKRQHLKYGLNLCERATQKILSYSNNFLHKRLKTEEKRFRAKPVKGKARLGLLPSFDDMAKKRCCVDNCVMMALTHRTLLEEWRRRSRQGQIEARRVIAEMLTPSACARKNCYTFVTAVTGSSRTTVVQVNQQMLHTGGNREPPAHGLKKYHDSNKKKAVEISPPVQNMLTEMTTNILGKHREQLLQLQQQVSDQQQQLQQQQHLQQQLLQQTLLSQGQNQNVMFLQQINNQLNIHIQNTQRGLQQTLHNMALLMGTSTTKNQTGSSSITYKPDAGLIRIEPLPAQSTSGTSVPNNTQILPQLNLVYDQNRGTGTKSVQLNTTNIPNAVNQNIVHDQSSGTIRVINNTPQMNGSQFVLSSPSYSVVPQQQSQQIIQAPQQITQTPQQTIQTQQQIQQIIQNPQQIIQTLQQQQITQTPQQIIQTPQQIIQTPQQMIQSPQQIIQNPQQIILTQQPNYPVNIVPGQSDQNIITLQSLQDIVIANQNRTAGDTIRVVNQEDPRTHNVFQTAQANDQSVFILEKVNLPSRHEGSKVAEVLSNVQVVEMDMPTSLDQIKNLNVTRTNNNLMEIIQNQLQNTDQNQVTTHSNTVDTSSHVIDAVRGKGKLSSASKRSKGNQPILLQDSSPPNMTVITSLVSNNASSESVVYTATPVTDSIVPTYIDDTNHLTKTNQSDIQKRTVQLGDGVHSLVNRQFVDQSQLRDSGVSDSPNVLNKELCRLLKAKMIKTKKVFPQENLLNSSDFPVVRSTADTVVHRAEDVNSSQNVNKSSISSKYGSHTATSQNIGKSESQKCLKTNKSPRITAPVLTSEYMNFSLPLSDVITLYTDTTTDKQSNMNNDQTKLDPSLQINPVPRQGAENTYSSSTVNLGSILIVDPDINNLIPKTVKEASNSTVNVRKIETKDKGNLVIIEENRNRSRNSSSGSHNTDTDSEVQQILQTNNTPPSSQSAEVLNVQQVQRLNTLPFKPLMRSDTVIYSPSRSDTLQLSPNLERSDTVKLPDTEVPEIYTLPVKKHKGKKKNLKRTVGNKPEVNKSRQNMPSSGETSQSARLQINNPVTTQYNATNPIILSGNLAMADQQWLHRLVNDMQKQK